MRLFCCLLLLVFSRAAFADAGDQAVALDISGAIGPATADYFHRGLEQAHELEGQFVVLRIDTPGGLDTAMRDMIKDILASRIPVVVGTYILYASHVAVMSPATNLGAATPIAIGGMPGSPKPQDQPAKEKKQDEQTDESADAPKATEEDWMSDATRRKAVFDAAAYIRGLAQLRGRNAEWAEKAVREAVSLSAEEAKRIGVIDLIATDLDDLLMKLDGREVKVAEDETVTLRTADIEVVEIQPDWRNRFLATITSPSVAYLLMLIGIYGLLAQSFPRHHHQPECGVSADADWHLRAVTGVLQSGNTDTRHRRRDLPANSAVRVSDVADQLRGGRVDTARHCVRNRGVIRHVLRGARRRGGNCVHRRLGDADRH
jgi:membrane-bound serine protease (ClpP class)